MIGGDERLQRPRMPEPVLESEREVRTLSVAATFVAYGRPDGGCQAFDVTQTLDAL
jgi:hypothetical protein